MPYLAFMEGTRKEEGKRKACVQSKGSASLMHFPFSLPPFYDLPCRLYFQHTICPIMLTARVMKKGHMVYLSEKTSKSIFFADVIKNYTHFLLSYFKTGKVLVQPVLEPMTSHRVR